MRVYYYTSAENAIDDIRNSHIKVSVLDGVNDPNEWVPEVVDGDGKVLPIDEVRSRVMATFNLEWGFISFCKSWDVAPMWGVYADRFKGAVLEFEIADELVNDRVYKVEYAPRRANCSTSIFANPTKDEFKNLVCRKSLDWEYEQEYRYLVQLLPRNCELKGKHYFARIGYGEGTTEKLKLTGVRCGPLMLNQDFSKLKFLLRQMSDKSKLRIVKMKFLESTFSLKEENNSELRDMGLPTIVRPDAE